MRINLSRIIIVISMGLVLISCTPKKIAKNQVDSAMQLRELADLYMINMLEIAQPYSYFAELEVERHNKFLDNSPQRLLETQKLEDNVLATLLQMDSSGWQDESQRVFYAKFIEELESNIQSRVCKSELWNISHMFGTHFLLDFLINVQPVATVGEQLDTLKRWRSIPKFYQQQIENLNQGLQKGYSAPQSVVKRIISQLQNTIAIQIDDHPYLKLAKRAGNPQFNSKFKALIANQVLPAMKNYVDYLENSYLSQARIKLAISQLPQGRACYVALYRANTSLKRTPEQVYQLGMETVNKNIAIVEKLGKKLYGTDTFADAIKLANEDESQKFSDAQQMHEFFVNVVSRAKKIMPEYFLKMPTIKMEVEAIPSYQQGTGQSAHYVSGSTDRLAKFAYDPVSYQSENHGSAEIVSLHEGYPGHHMQIALVQNQQKFHPLEATFSNSAYSEGWARYAESLSEEAGLYRSKSAKILRRAWPARGMVADVALHILGWSNEKVTDYFVESGASFINDTDTMLDRMAVMPSQLTSYDSGALEIFALRRQMEQQMGKDFDIKQFHQLILKNGSVPMDQLKKQTQIK